MKVWQQCTRRISKNDHKYIIYVSEIPEIYYTFLRIEGGESRITRNSAHYCQLY